MPKFLEDYSGLAAAGAGFQSFADSFERAQDSKAKRQEMSARMEAEKSRAQREADQTAIQARVAGLRKNATGDFEEAPLTPKGQLDTELKAGSEGFKLVKGPDGVQHPVVDTTTPKYKASLIPAQRLTDLNDNRADTKDRREHASIIGQIKSNPAAKQKLGQFQGLSNALSIITDSDHITPEQIHEFQQAIRGNMGMKGSGGVGEREETYFKSLNLNAARMKEFLTGDPASIAKDSKLLDHFRQLAAIEQGNIKKQYERSLNAASGGHGSMYSRRPDLKQDLEDLLNSERGQMESAPQQAPAQEAPPQGLVQPQQGLLGRIAGFLSPSAQAKPQAEPAQAKPQTVIQNGHTYTLNLKTGQYE